MTFNKVIVCDIKNKSKTSVVNPSDYKKTLKEYEYPCELVAGEDQQVKPYFDADPVDDDSYDWEADILEKQLTIKNMFDDTIDITDIYVNKRQYEKDGKIKYSSHYTVDGIRMSYYNIKLLLEKNECTDFDMSVYDKNRGVYGPYTNKKCNLDKELPPFLPQGNADISKYLISYIEEDFTDWDEKFPKPIKKENKSKSVNSVLSQILTSKYEDYDLVKSLVGCFKKDRAEDYAQWLDVGFCLYNISDDLLELWDNFSQLSDKYKSCECEKLWSKMDKRSFSIGSLKYWAKQDNPKMYNDVIKNSMEKYVDLCISNNGTHSDTADVMAKLFTDKIIYDKKVKSWYIVNEKTNLWDCDKEGEMLKLLIKKDVCSVFISANLRYMRNCETSDEVMKDVWIQKAKQALAIASKVKDNTYQKNVFSQLKPLCIRDDFFELYINKKEHLLAFDNGVYDLNLKLFRPIEPTDYISITCGYNYNPNVEAKYIEDVQRILKDIQPETDKYNYMIDILSTRLYGKNIHQQFYIMTGSGANGKSVLYNMMRHAFGKYCGKINAETFTKESKGANQTSELAGVALSRNVIIEEPNENDKLIVNRLKELSGDAPVKTRGLYQEAFEFMPQFALIFMCNEIPKLSKVEYAIARRLRVLSFDTKFCESPVLSHEKPLDISLNEKIANDVNYKMAFMKLLIDNWYKSDLKNKLDTPQCVIESSKEYMDGCNEVKIYLEEYYIKVEDEKQKIGAKVLYDHFKAMYRTSNVSNVTFKALVEKEGFRNKKIHNSAFYINIVEKPRDYSDSVDFEEEC